MWLGLSGAGESQTIYRPVTSGIPRQPSYFGTVFQGTTPAQVFHVISLRFIRHRDIDALDQKFHCNISVLFYDGDRPVDASIRKNWECWFWSDQISSTSVPVVSTGSITFTSVRVDVVLTEHVAAIQGIQIVSTFVAVGGVNLLRNIGFVLTIPVMVLLYQYLATSHLRHRFVNFLSIFLCIVAVLAADPLYIALSSAIPNFARWELPSYKATGPLLRQCYRFYVFSSIRDFIWRPEPAGICFLVFFVTCLVICCACAVFASWTAFSEVRAQKSFRWGDPRVENFGTVSEGLPLLWIVVLAFQLSSSSRGAACQQMFWFVALLGIAFQSAALMIVLNGKDIVTFAGEVFGISVHLAQTAVVLGYKRTEERRAASGSDGQQKVAL
jgi:hypothetical protein